MKLQFEINDSDIERLEGTCWIAFEIEPNMDKFACGISLMNNESMICPGFIKENCPLKEIKE